MPTNPEPARDRLFALIASIPGSGTVDWCDDARALLAEIAASAVVSSPPATDRATVLRGAADALEAKFEGASRATIELRRMADEARQPETTWTPPPPGDTREQLPDHILALLTIPDYESTACEMARLLTNAITFHPEDADELTAWAGRMRRRCRENNKFTGRMCEHVVGARQPDTETQDDIQVWPLQRVLTEVRCGSQDWTWDEEWADLDRRHVDTGYLAKLEQQIGENGITMPVLIGSDGRLWDGHHRLRIAVRLGIGYVPVEIVPPTAGGAGGVADETGEGDRD